MGERKGVNKYYPPDFDYKKHGSLDRYHNSHPLRERARKLKTEGILIIRFEMPYNIWCNGCNKHIGMGVRYNAEKKKVGNYYSTIIYKFRMKCHLCPQYFEIQTDPANCDYVILSGARRKEERWDAKANEQIEMTDHKDKQQLMTDPMYKLEHGVKDKQKLQTVIPTLNEIRDIQQEKRDDYLLNKALRKTFREQKKKIEKAQESDRKLLLKSSLDIPLLEETEEDKKLSKLIKYNTISTCNTKRDVVREQIINQSILPTSSKSRLLQSDKTGKIPDSNLTSKSLGIKVGKRRLKSDNSNLNLPTKRPKSETITNIKLTQSNDTSTVTCKTGIDNDFSSANNSSAFTDHSTTFVFAKNDSDVIDSASNLKIFDKNNTIVANYSSSDNEDET